MDIVERLATAAQWDGVPSELLNEAADHIEELEGRLSALEDAVEELGFSESIRQYEQDSMDELKSLLAAAIKGKTNETR